MGRATFEGPLLSGDNRFGPLRNVGYSQLVQNVDLDISNAVNGSSTYAGSSGQFVVSNGVPNVNGTVFTPSSTVYPAVAQTIPADSATNVYRGAVFYLPTGADLDDVFLDVATAFSVTGGTASLTSVQFLVSNNYTAAAGTAAYFTTGVLTSNAVGRQSLSTFTGTQILNQSTTSTDILQANGQPNLSQVVITIAMVGTALNTRTSMAGQLNVTLRYTQPDNNIGTLTTYPYGNFD
jgi:hypothetical protein